MPFHSENESFMSNQKRFLGEGSVKFLADRCVNRQQSHSCVGCDKRKTTTIRGVSVTGSETAFHP